MCFRVSRKMPNEEWLIDFHVEEKDATVSEMDMMPSYNISPGVKTLVIYKNPDTGKNTLGAFKWGLVPHWAADPAIGRKLANARGETLLEKPSFRDAFKKTRCLFIADGFYEWITDPASGKKLPYYIHLKHGKPFAFAGLYSQWECPDKGELLMTCAIITTSPNSLIEKIHDRMPVILDPGAHDQWTTPGFSPGLQNLLNSFPSGLMEAYRVSTFVNKAGNDSPECARPLKENELF